jgi:protocatechuate 3,4-dioxygenase alpha subunit
MAARTPSQTIGPFFHEALRWPEGARLVPAQGAGRVVLLGRILDGGKAPVGDAMVEAWISSPRGFGRVESAADGAFRFDLPMPGSPIPSLDIAIFARGLLKPVRTRVYLAPEERARGDPALGELAASPRLKTLVATPSGPGEFRWEVRLQGEGETVFFAP